MKWGYVLELTLRFLAWFLDRAQASDKTKKKFLELIEATKEDGLVTVKVKDTFEEQYKEVMQVGESDSGDGV